MIRNLRSATALGAFVVATFAVCAQANADCNITQGERVILFSSSYDPDVLVWDSRGRLVDYAAGSWETKRALLSHAMLARAGTRALVLQCQGNVIHPKYRLATQDAVGVKMISGPYRGRYGWIAIDDLRRRR